MSSRYDRVYLEEALGGRLCLVDQCESTNDLAFELAAESRDESLVVLARTQTKGRGRRGAAWMSEGEGGVAMSLALRPNFPRELWHRLALGAGVAVAQAAEEFGVLAEIKWPNDVWLNGHKLAGVLVESRDDVVVVGVGVNVAAGAYGGALQGEATSLQEAGAEGVSREDFLIRFVSYFDSVEKLVANDFVSVVASARSRCALKGKRISFRVGGVEEEGECLGISDGGELLVRLASGEVKRYLALDEVRPIE